MLLWPLTRPGYLLGHDLVFTARQPLDRPAIGVGSAAPRAVPLDALVALAERLVDGAVVGRLALVLPLLGAGAGVAFLLRAAPVWARVAGAGAAVWNPFVVERMALGQWALLWCYAALPWLVHATTRGRGRSGWAARALALAAASITPTGGVLAAVSAVALAGSRRHSRRDVAATAGLAVVLQLPWLVPAVVSTATATSDPAGVTAFAARDEQGGGALLSLLGGGGIWDADVVPGSRGGPLAWLWLVVLVAAAGYGARPLSRRLGARTVITLAWLSAAGVVLAALPTLPGGAAVVRAAVEHVPGAGLLRDSQKWVLPLVLLEALLVGAAAGRLAGALRRGPARALAGIAAALLPVLLLPDAAATLQPTLRPVHYPHDWTVVANRIAGGDAAVLPWGSYRAFAWAPGRTVLDPAPRLLPVATVVDDRLAVSGRLLRGEDERAAAVGRALAAGPGLVAGLARAGIRWVVVEHGTPGPVPSLAALHPVHAGTDVALYRVPGPVPAHRPAAGRVAAVVAGDVLAAGAVLVLLAAAAAGAIRPGTRRKTGRRAAPLL